MHGPSVVCLFLGFSVVFLAIFLYHLKHIYDTHHKEGILTLQYKNLNFLRSDFLSFNATYWFCRLTWPSQHPVGTGSWKTGSRKCWRPATTLALSEKCPVSNTGFMPSTSIYETVIMANLLTCKGGWNLSLVDKH